MATDRPQQPEAPAPFADFNVDDLKVVRAFMDRVINNGGRLDKSSLVQSHRTGSNPASGVINHAEAAKMGHPYACLRSMQAQIDVVGSVQQSLTDMFTHFRTRWCSSGKCGIYKLPDEILSYVFKLATPKEFEAKSLQYNPGSPEQWYDSRWSGRQPHERHVRLKAALSLSAVSRRFREVALHTHAIWNTLYPSLPADTVSQLITRTQDAALTVHIGPHITKERGYLHAVPHMALATRDRIPPVYFTSVLPHSRRWEALTVTYRDEDDAQSFVHACRENNSTFERLHSLTIIVPYGGRGSGVTRPYLDFLPLLSEGNASQADTAASPVHTLQQCDIRLRHGGMALVDALWFMSTLARFQALQHLSLSFSFVLPMQGNIGPPPQIPVHDFPNMQTLAITLYGSSIKQGLHRLIACIRAPRLQTLILHADAQDWSHVWLDEVVDSLKSVNGTFQNLQNFDLEYTIRRRSGQNDRTKAFPDFFPFMPSLQCLAISGNGLLPPYHRELAENGAQEFGDRPLPSLRSLRFKFMSDLEKSYLIPLIAILQNRLGDRFEQLDIDMCSKVRAADAEEVRQHIGPDRLQFRESPQMSDRYLHLMDEWHDAFPVPLDMDDIDYFDSEDEDEADFFDVEDGPMGVQPAEWNPWVPQPVD